MLTYNDLLRSIIPINNSLLLGLSHFGAHKSDFSFSRVLNWFSRSRAWDSSRVASDLLSTYYQRQEIERREIRQWGEEQSWYFIWVGPGRASVIRSLVSRDPMGMNEWDKQKSWARAFGAEGTADAEPCGFSEVHQEGHVARVVGVLLVGGGY